MSATEFERGERSHMAALPIDDGDERQVQAMLLRAARGLEADADDIAEAIADVLIREVPEISSDAETREDILHRGRAGLQAWAFAYARGVKPESPAEAYAFARVLARRGIPLNVLIRIHSLAFGVLLCAWEERLGVPSSPQQLRAATQRSLDVNFRFHDALMEGLTAEYERERERWVRGADALRRETIHALLDEQALDTDRASAVLSYDLRRHHIAFVLWAEPTPDDPQVVPRLERAAGTAAALLDASRPLMLSVDSRTLWAWVSRDTEVPRAQLDQLSSCLDTGGVSVAVGASGRGPSGFRRSHRDAVDTARVATISHRRSGAVLTFYSVQLAALLAADLDRTRRFVQERLSELAWDDDECSRLRATLMIYLEENGSRLATAERIGVHPNTVANRIRACRELLEQDPGREQTLLMVALALAGTLGPAVLRERS